MLFHFMFPVVCNLFVQDMLIGASETSCITVEWTMANLLRHPSKMHKLRAEIAASLGSKDFVEESDLGKLPYLHAVMKETLRLHPAVPVATREVAADGVSLGGFPMPIGTCVLVNLWAIGTLGGTRQYGLSRTSSCPKGSWTPGRWDSGAQTLPTGRSGRVEGCALDWTSPQGSCRWCWPPCCTRSSGSCPKGWSPRTWILVTTPLWC